MNEETKFEVGDSVEWCGAIGNVIEPHFTSGSPYTVFVVFNNEHYQRFTEDGKSNHWHTEPSLKLISKAKKKRKVKLYAHLNNEYFQKLEYFKEIMNKMTRIPDLDKEVEVED